MNDIETDSSEMWRLIGAALLLAVVCGAAALMALRADAQPPAEQPQAAIAAPMAAPAPVSGAAAAVSTPAVSTAPTAPTAPATHAPPADQIPDDPTVAPDPSQKADNNVSFPVDI